MRNPGLTGAGERLRLLKACELMRCMARVACFETRSGDAGAFLSMTDGFDGIEESSSS